MLEIVWFNSLPLDPFTMKPYRQFKPFQLRWKEAMGRPECPYLYRWTLVLFGYSIRLHHWLRSDDKRFFHDHPSDFLSVVLWGGYTNVISEYPKTPYKRVIVRAGSAWFAKADKQHYLDIPKGGAWTLLIFGKPYHKWGFYVNGHKWRPLRYFHKFGIPACDCQ